MDSKANVNNYPLENTTNKDDEYNNEEKTIKESKESSQQNNSSPTKLYVCMDKQITLSKPNVNFEEIIGAEQQKTSLTEVFLLPILYPEFFKDIIPIYSALLYGPKGTGKSLLSKACVKEFQSNFLLFQGEEILSKPLQEAKQKISRIFNTAQENKPSIVLIEDIDQIFPLKFHEENYFQINITTQFLIELDQAFSKGVFVLATSNAPWRLHDRVLKRFQRRIYTDLPDSPSREIFLKRKLSKTSHIIQEEDLKTLVSKTEGYSYSDLSVLIRTAYSQRIKKAQEKANFTQSHDYVKLREVLLDDFNDGLTQVKARTTSKENEKFERFRKEFDITTMLNLKK